MILWIIFIFFPGACRARKMTVTLGIFTKEPGQQAEKEIIPLPAVLPKQRLVRFNMINDIKPVGL
jgi:hypothetical protein